MCNQVVMLELFQTFLHILFVRARGVIKWVLRRLTRLCELQRICYGIESGAPRTLAVERSLSSSRFAPLRQLLVYKWDRQSSSLRLALEHACVVVLHAKRINPKVHSQFANTFLKCLEQSWGYLALCEDIEALRKIQFDSENPKHEEKLFLLWKTLVPDVPLETRITKQWQDIGFQGEDPKTDFRGMGILGLDNLIYFSQEHTSIAQRILNRSLHPKTGYAFAIVGINLTHLAYSLVREGVAKTHVYNATRSPATIRSFHQIYCYLFVEFDKFWLASKPENIMDFSPIKQRFEMKIRENLKDPRAVFRLIVGVDNL